jgi:hypothetical protein
MFQKKLSHVKSHMAIWQWYIYIHCQLPIEI